MAVTAKLFNTYTKIDSELVNIFTKLLFLHDSSVVSSMIFYNLIVKIL